jgi:hypothetical protein
MYIIGVCLTGVHLTGCASLGCVSHWACTSLDVYLMSVCLMGAVCVEALRFFNSGFLGKIPPYFVWDELVDDQRRCQNHCQQSQRFREGLCHTDDW